MSTEHCSGSHCSDTEHCSDSQGGYGLYCRNNTYNWCSRLDRGLSNFDYDQTDTDTYYYYRLYYPKCVKAKYLRSDQMQEVEMVNKKGRVI